MRKRRGDRLASRRRNGMATKLELNSKNIKVELDAGASVESLFSSGLRVRVNRIEGTYKASGVSGSEIEGEVRGG
jgi:hypothetical protein